MFFFVTIVVEGAIDPPGDGGACIGGIVPDGGSWGMASLLSEGSGSA